MAAASMRQSSRHATLRDRDEAVTRTRGQGGREDQRPQKHTLMSQRHYAELALAALVIALLVALSNTLKSPSHFPIREVRIEGDLVHLTEAAFREHLTDLTDVGLFSVDVHAIRSRLMDEPWVRDISIRRVWPDTLTVHVTEQVAVARWNEGAAVNAWGEAFDPPTADLDPGLPLLSGPEDSVAEVIAMVHTLDTALRPLGLQADSVRLTAQREWWVGLSDGRTLVLGRAELEPRLQRFVLAFNGHLGARWPDIRRIDMRYPNGFSVQWKDNEEK